MTLEAPNGETIRLLREFRGISAAQLAEFTGVSRSLIAAIESRGTKGASLTVHAIADGLRVRGALLFRPVPPSVTAGVMHFRKRAGTRRSLEKRLGAAGALFEHVVEVALDGVTTPKDTFPTQLQFASPEEAAAACRDAWEIPDDAPIANLARYMERSGAIIGTFADDESIDAFSWARSRPLVLFNRTSPPSRRRFSLAHECGHLVLHRGRAGGDAAMEQEANEFAAALLLPRKGLRREFPSGRIEWHELLALKRRWGVSVQAILHRAHELEILSSRHYRSCFIHLSRMGWRKCEPGEDIHAEQPELFPAILNALVETSVGRFAEAMASWMPMQLIEDVTGHQFVSRNQGVLSLDDFRQRRLA